MKDLDHVPEPGETILVLDEDNFVRCVVITESEAEELKSGIEASKSKRYQVDASSSIRFFKPVEGESFESGLKAHMCIMKFYERRAMSGYVYNSRVKIPE